MANRSSENNIMIILNSMIEQARKEVKECEGGRNEYIETLQDSDTFYNEALADGKIYALEQLKEKIKDIK